MLNFPPYSAALPKQLSWHNLVPKVSRLQSLFLAIACTIDAILTDIANVFHIWASLAGESARDLSQSETEKYFKWISMCLYVQIDCSAKYLLGRTERTYMLKGNTLVFRYIKRHGVGTECCACKSVIDRVLNNGITFLHIWMYVHTVMEIYLPEVRVGCMPKEGISKKLATGYTAVLFLSSLTSHCKVYSILF